MFSREELVKKTVRELKEIAKSMNIVGVSKKRHAVIVDRILEEQEAATSSISNEETSTNQSVPTGVEFNAVSKATVSSSSKDIQTFCRISSGATSKQFDVAGYTLSGIMEFMREILNIERHSTPIVNGKQVDDMNYVVKPGDNIEFVKESGQKG